MSRESRESRERIRHCNPSFVRNFGQDTLVCHCFINQKWEDKPKSRESQETYLNVVF